LAIYQNNLKAFSEDNVNTLIKNKKLKIPPVSYFENHTHMEARKILRDHNNAWKNRVKEITKKTKSKIKQPVTSSNKDNEKIKQLEKELVQAKQKIEQISKNVEEKKLPNIEKIDAPIANKITSKDVFQNKEDLNKVETIKNKIVEKDDGVFVSAISDIDDGQIIESEINSQDKKGLETIHILLLTLFFVLLFGLIVVISRRKANERNQQLRSFSEEVEAQNENNNDQSLNSSKQFETKNPVSNQKDSEDSAHQDQSNPTAKKNYLPIADDEETKKL
jgi:hypothetical protein